MKFSISDLFSKIFYPGDFACVICDEKGTKRSEHGGAVVCDKCFSQLTKVKDPVCIKCGRQIGAEGMYCKICVSEELIFDKCAAVYCYSGAAREWIHSLKYSNKPWHAKYMAHLMAEKYNSCSWNCDLVTFVPAHANRERGRGYNQAELLAQEICSVINIPCMDLLKRTKKTVPQSHLTAKERKENISGAITANGSCQADIAGKTILIVDDILTTASTISECARALKQSGACKVFGLCLCAVKDF